MDRGGTTLSAIVIDASVIGPMILPDERPLPAAMENDMIARTLSAPAHWPVETGNMLLIARRRGRIDDRGWNAAFERLLELRISIAAPFDSTRLRNVLRLAEDHRLTVYDAAYLDLALASSAALATLDRRLADAGRNVGVTLFDLA